jgi:hypothetical protein
MMSSENIVESQAFLIIWAKSPQVLLFHTRICGLLLIPSLPDRTEATTLMIAALSLPKTDPFQ